MRYFVTIGERTLEVELGEDGVRVDGRAVDVSLGHADGTPVRGLLVGSESYRILADRENGGGWAIRTRGLRVEVDVVDERTRAIREMTGTRAGPSGPRPIVAPMPGMIVKVEVIEGDLVEAGRGVVIVEAMKMENELRASCAGRVSRVHVKAGDAVGKDQILVEIEAVEATA